MEDISSSGWNILIAEAEAKTQGVRLIAEDARTAGDVDKIEIADKLVEFCEAEEMAVRHYAHMATEYPEMLPSLKLGWPHFETMLSEAKRNLEKRNSENSEG